MMQGTMGHARTGLVSLAAVAILAAAPATSEVPEAVRRLEILNVHMPQEGLLTAGQLTREQMKALNDLGYKTFISLRAAGEEGSGWEEDFAQTIKAEFVRIPVAGASDLDEKRVRALAGALQSASGPTALYCGSSNRVGALLALKTHLLDGRSADESLQFGRAAGLAGLEPTVRKLLGLQPKD